MNLCGIIVPRQNCVVGYRDDGYLAECILPYGHYDFHVVRTPEDEYFAWWDDWDCDCCGPEEDQRCYVYTRIEESEVLALLKKVSRI